MCRTYFVIMTQELFIEKENKFHEMNVEDAIISII